MEEDKYQFHKKSLYLNFLILRDELQTLDLVLSQQMGEAKDLLTKFRATRSVFLILNNVKDAADRMQLKASQDFIKKTRNIKKRLVFANHFRNRGIGHLDGTLLNGGLNDQVQHLTYQVRYCHDSLLSPSFC